MEIDPALAPEGKHAFELMFGCIDGDFCHGLRHSDQMGFFRPGPGGWPDAPVPFGGLFLGGAGCHGGPGVTFVPGYNAGHAALDAADRLVAGTAAPAS